MRYFWWLFWMYVWEMGEEWETFFVMQWGVGSNGGKWWMILVIWGTIVTTYWTILVEFNGARTKPYRRWSALSFDSAMLVPIIIIFVLALFAHIWWPWYVFLEPDGGIGGEAWREPVRQGFKLSDPDYFEEKYGSEAMAKMLREAGERKT